MDTTKHNNTGRKRDSMWEYLTAGVVGLTAGMIAAVNTVRREFFDDIRHLPEIAKEIKRVTEELEKKWRGTDMSAVAEAEQPKARSALFKFIAEEKSKRDGKIAEILERKGYRSTGWGGLRSLTLGTYDRARQLSHESRVAILINSAITAGVAIGGTYMFLKNRHTHEEVSDVHDKVDHIAEALDQQTAHSR